MTQFVEQFDAVRFPVEYEAQRGEVQLVRQPNGNEGRFQLNLQVSFALSLRQTNRE